MGYKMSRQMASLQVFTQHIQYQVSSPLTPPTHCTMAPSQNPWPTESMNIIECSPFAPLVLGWFFNAENTPEPPFIKHMQRLRFTVIMHVEFFSNNFCRCNLHR